LYAKKLLEPIDELMRADKIELINVAFLLKNTPVKVIYIKLQEIRPFKLMDF
jgi:hypothetical protein